MKEKKEKEKSTWKSIRGLFNTIHLWLGVGSSLILFIVCLTGTIYTFAPEIQKVTDSELYTVKVKSGAKRIPTETLLATVLTSLNGGEVQSLIIPEAADASYQITIGKKEEKSKEDKPKEERSEGKDRAKGGEGKPGGEKNAGPPQRPRGTTYFVNPYTAEILGTNETSSSAFFSVHVSCTPLVVVRHGCRKTDRWCCHDDFRCYYFKWISDLVSKENKELETRFENQNISKLETCKSRSSQCSRTLRCTLLIGNGINRIDLVV